MKNLLSFYALYRKYFAQVLTTKIHQSGKFIMLKNVDVIVSHFQYAINNPDIILGIIKHWNAV